MPIGISALALAVSAASLTWNVVRDLLLRARVRTDVQVVKWFTAARQVAGTYVEIRATNLGPGPVHITSIGGKLDLVSRIRGDQGYYQLIPDSSIPGNHTFPKRLEVGESFSTYFPFDKDCFRKTTSIATVGVHDSFRRNHFAARRSLKKAFFAFEENFGERKRLSP